MAPIRRGSTAQPLYIKQHSSIYRGVSLHKGTLKFRANIKIKGKKIALGAYSSEVEAAEAFDRAAVRYRGARAELNFPEQYRPLPEASGESSSHLPGAEATSEADMLPCASSSYDEDAAADELLLNAIDSIDPLDLADVLEYEAGVVSPFQAEALASDSSSSGDAHALGALHISRQPSDTDSQQQAAACSLASQPTVHSLPPGYGLSAPGAHFALASPQARAQLQAQAQPGPNMEAYKSFLFSVRDRSASNPSDCESETTDVAYQSEWSPAVEPISFGGQAPAALPCDAWWKQKLPPLEVAPSVAPLHVSRPGYHPYARPVARARAPLASYGPARRAAC